MHVKRKHNYFHIDKNKIPEHKSQYIDRPFRGNEYLGWPSHKTCELCHKNSCLKTICAVYESYSFKTVQESFLLGLNFNPSADHTELMEVPY